jgi:23S rRNA (adenine2030-N6)-methyltransferase
MNYRHAYHAGNHADILKHIVIARIVEHLKLKEKPFRVLDVHAGIGVYDLESNEALKTLEWQDGLGRLYKVDGSPVQLSEDAEALISPWRSAVAACNANDGLRRYPGSPRIVRHLVRPQDRIILNELHPVDAEALRVEFARDRLTSITELDAAIAIKSQLPPPERRGLVLVDPPYERTDEVERIITMLGDGLSRFATGIYCIWYPVTGDGLDARLGDALRLMSLKQVLQVELNVRPERTGGGLSGSGLYVVNPPWQLDRDLQTIVPELARLMRQEADGSAIVRWLAPTA